MDVKQIDLGNCKSMINSNSIKRLILFVNNLEEKLSFVKTTHDKLNELIIIVSKTHENILEELNNIKNILNQHNQLIKTNENKFQWNDDDDEQIQSTSSIKKFDSKSVTDLTSTNSPSIHQNDRLTLSSPSSYQSSSTNSSNTENRPNSSNSKRSSNLKQIDQTSIRPKSPKSVTFSLKDNQHPHLNINQKQQNLIENIEEPSNEKVNIDSNESIKENCDLIPDLFKQHHNEVTNKENIGYKLGNALTNVRIHEIESINGNYLRLLNISNSDDYDLSGHFLQQNIACVPLSRFKFPLNTIIRAGQTITIWCGTTTEIEPQPPHIFIWKEQKKWETGPECVTILAKPTGQAIAWARSSNRINTDQSSSDILFLHSKSNLGTSDISTILPTFKSRSRLSAFNFIGNHKPPFAHSPSSPIHPNHNGGYSNIPNDLRSQMHHRSGISQLLNRPKSSPFSSHTGCKQDLISMNFLRTQGHKKTTVKT